MKKNCRDGGNNMRTYYFGCQERIDGVYCPAAASESMPTAQLRSSAFKHTQETKACRKGPAKVITMNVSGGNSNKLF